MTNDLTKFATLREVKIYTSTTRSLGKHTLPTETEKGTPRRIRTFDLRIRSPLLYPAELRALVSTV